MLSTDNSRSQVRSVGHRVMQYTRREFQLTQYSSLVNLLLSGLFKKIDTQSMELKSSIKEQFKYTLFYYLTHLVLAMNKESI